MTLFLLLLSLSFLLAATTNGFSAANFCSPFPPASDPCTKPYWSQHGVTVAGNGTIGLSKTQLCAPTGIFVDDWDDLHVADAGNNRIQVFFNGSENIGETEASSWGSPYGPIKMPGDLFVDAVGFVYIVNKYNGELLRWSPARGQGTTMAQGGIVNWGQYTQYLYGVGGDRYGAIYLSEHRTYPSTSSLHDTVRVLKYPKNVLSAEYSRVVGMYNSSNRPGSIAVDQCDNLYLVDELGRRLLKFSNGSLTPEVVVTAPDFFPKDITFDTYGNIYIVEEMNNRVQRLSVRDGTMEVIVGSASGNIGNDTEHFLLPFSLALDSQNNLYVSDTGNHRVQRFEFLGGDLSC